MNLSTTNKQKQPMNLPSTRRIAQGYYKVVINNQEYSLTKRETTNTWDAIDTEGNWIAANDNGKKWLLVELIESL